MKRPVVWFALAYVFGEILGFISWKLWLPVILTGSVLCVWSGRKKKHILERICLFVLPVFCLWGCLMIGHEAQREQQLVAQIQMLPDDFEGKVIDIKVKKSVKMLYLRCSVDSEGLKEREFTVCCQLPLEDEKVQYISLYDRIKVSGYAELFEKASNPGCYDAYETYRQEGIFYLMQDCRITEKIKKGPKLMSLLARLRDSMKQVIFDSLSDDRAAVLSAMVTGEKALVPEEMNSLYQSQGIAHIMAISGLHVTMAGMGILSLLKRLYVPVPLRQIVALTAAVLYICMCGFSISAMRAVVMFAAAMGGDLIGRKTDRATSLSAAGLVILIRTPMALFSFSFLMSFGCMISMIIMTGMHGKLAGFYISAVTLPILAWFQYEIPLYSVLLNMAVVPMMGILYPMGLIGSLVGGLWPVSGKVLCRGAGVILTLYEYLCRITEKLPLSVLIVGRPSLWQCIVIYICLLLFFVISVKMRENKITVRKSVMTCFAYLLIMTAFILLFMRFEPKQLKIIYVGVGQGDCSIIRAPDGTVVMIDGGSSSEKEIGKYTIEKVLKYYGMGRVDYMILSHMDSDHVNGAQWLIENGWQVGSLVLPKVICDAQMREMFIKSASEKNIPVRIVGAGDALNMGNVRVSCLHPSGDFVTESDNAASAVFELSYGNCRFLFTGDVEGEGEERVTAYLAEQKTEEKMTKHLAGQGTGEGLTEYMAEQETRENTGTKKTVTVLKVAHHGSKNSTSEDFLEALMPEYAVISCKKNNMYGHPHRELLERLENIGCLTAVTGYSGAVLVKSDGNSIWIRMYR